MTRCLKPACRRSLPGVVALVLVVSGCGGTRVDAEEIRRAAGLGLAPATAPVRPVAPVQGAVTTSTVPTDEPTKPVTDRRAALAPDNLPETAQSRPRRTSDAAPRRSVAASVAPQKSAAPATGVLDKSVIKLGVVGTFSGPVGALVKDTATGIRVWAQHTNAGGGVNGHPVEVLVGDDGGDPARFIALQKQFLEQDGVLAFLYSTLGFSPNGNNKYLDSKKIFTFGTDGGLDVAYVNPYVLTPTPVGRTLGDSIMFALSKVALPQGRTNFASFTCSDIGLCDLYDERWTNPEVLKRTGFTLTARGRPSLTQPDYTAQCLAARNAEAEVFMAALDTASLRRVAGDCARQNYRPIFGTVDLLALANLPSDPNVDGLVVASRIVPWVDTRVPGIAELHQAFAQYSPRTVISGGMANGWLLGEFFAAAGKNLPDAPTQADLADGIYSIKNENLNGMTYPITLTRGQPAQRQLCYGVVVIKDRAYSQFPGPSLYCEKSVPLG
ncbi:MAG: ABC transporter substrate-binding protein [Sporichthyaceae bacterium]